MAIGREQTRSTKMKTLRETIEKRLVSRMNYTPSAAATAVDALARTARWLNEADVVTADAEELVRRYEALDLWAASRGIAISDLLESGEDVTPTFEEFDNARVGLLSQLEGFGTHDAFGNGDFFLVDSRTPSKSLLLEVRAAHILDSRALDQLSIYMYSVLPGWSLVVRFDDLEEDLVLPR